MTRHALKLLIFNANIYFSAFLRLSESGNMPDKAIRVQFMGVFEILFQLQVQLQEDHDRLNSDLTN
jgi:hypothetical protein